MKGLQLQTSAAMSEEGRRAELGDARRSERLGVIVEAVAREPGESFPELMGSDSELEAFYRFVNNESVDLQAVLQPHVASTVERCSRYDTVLIVHDTTGLTFQGSSRIGLGRKNRSEQEFFAHVSIAVAPGENRNALGVVATETWSRIGPRKGRRSPRKLLADPNRESLRWHRAVQTVSDRFGNSAHLLHVMDREGDCFELLAQMVKGKQRFVVRLAHDRTLDDDGAKLYKAIEGGRVLLKREVRLSTRRAGCNPRERKIHPARSERQATLAVSATPVVFMRPDSAARKLPEGLPVHVVLVREINPPAGTEPVVWRLVTTEPAGTAEEVAAIVDAYRNRWIIEELFKALKTGCQYERRQLESRHALEVVLGIFLPIAWRLLVLRTLARQAPNKRGTALTSQQIDVLRACGKAPLKNNPTNREVLMCLAALGGHIKNNGEPGWIVLGRAFEKLLLLELGWRAASAVRKM